MDLKSTAAALAAALGLGVALPAGAGEPGWYFVAFGGPTTAQGMSLNRSDQNLNDIFARAGLDVVAIDSSLDDSDTGFGVAGGYQLNEHFAFEFSYLTLGSTNYHAIATVTDGTDTEDADVTLETKADGPVVSMLGILPIGERFSVYGRAGISFLTADGTARITIADNSQRASQSSQKTDPVFGVGAEYNFNKYFAVRLAWDRHLDVGTDDVSGKIDADLISIGFRVGSGWFR
jgi:OOP family OmpA-OmpF porin